MALKIQFVDGSVVEYLVAEEGPTYWDGADRRQLRFEIAVGTIGVDALNALCTEENTASLLLINDEMAVANCYDGYVIKTACGIEPKLVDAEAGTYEDIIVLKLCKRTVKEADAKETANTAEAAEAQAIYTAMMTDTLLEV